jgi:hypothetical protein
VGGGRRDEVAEGVVAVGVDERALAGAADIREGVAQLLGLGKIRAEAGLERDQDGADVLVIARLGRSWSVSVDPPNRLKPAGASERGLERSKYATFSLRAWAACCSRILAINSSGVGNFDSAFALGWVEGAVAGAAACAARSRRLRAPGWVVGWVAGTTAADGAVVGWVAGASANTPVHVTSNARQIRRIIVESLPVG